MGYGLVGDWVGGIPMTSERLEGIKEALIKEGVSDAGAGQFIRSETVATLSDRQALLGVINKVVRYYPRVRHGKGGKG
ncbi:MAG: hypothetical protein ABI539_04395 [Acidobacteriota bacterium]